MRGAAHWTVACLVLVACLATARCQTAYQVVHLTELCRHGARTPLSDALKLDINKKYGKGALTGNGQRQQFLLGSKLRVLYPQIFQEFNPAKFELLVSSTARTILSAQSQAAGLYPFGLGVNMTVDDSSSFSKPPFQGGEWTFKNTSALPHAFRPLNYVMRTASIDNMFFSDFATVCPNAFKVRQEVSKRLADELADWTKALLSDLKNAGLSSRDLFGKEVFTFENIATLGDEFKAYFNYYGRPYGSLSDDLHEKVSRLLQYKFAIESGDDKTNRLVTNEQARKIVNTMAAIVNGTETKKNFLLLSGHDSNIFAQLVQLNLTTVACLKDWAQMKPLPQNCLLPPDYAAALIYELCKKGEEYFVRATLNNQPVQVCPANVDGHYCKFEDFRRTFETKLFYAFDDGPEFCGNLYFGIDREKLKSDYNSLLFIGGGFGVVFLGLVVVFIFLNLKEKRYLQVQEAAAMDYKKVPATGKTRSNL
jgi:hypothetical protein